MQKRLEFTIDLRYHERNDAKEGCLQMKQPTFFFSLQQLRNLLSKCTVLAWCNKKISVQEG